MSRVKKAQTRRASDQNDQLVQPQIKNVAQVGGTAVTDEDFQTAVLSQIKQIIFGLNAGKFYDDFAALGIKNLSELTVSGAVSSFSANCLASVAVGDLVYVGGVTATVPDVFAVDITDYDKLPSVGVVVSKTTAVLCVVQTSGLVTGVYTGLIPGKIYFAGTGANPKPVNPPPTTPAASWIFIQPVGTAITDTILSLNVSGNLTKVPTPP